MGWQNTSVEVGEQTFSAHRKQNTFSVPCASGLEAGDTFKAEGKIYKASSLTDWLNRGEVFHVEVMEVKNDKPKTRRIADNTGSNDLDSKSNDGRSGKS
jgi:hypothetical protein